MSDYQLAHVIAGNLATASKRVRVGSRYMHVKSGITYDVVTIAISEHALTPEVVYRSVLEPHVTWVRPLENFLERFELVYAEIGSNP